jgi:hypothetical protein
VGRGVDAPMVPIAMPAFAPGLRVALGASTCAAASPAAGGAESGTGAGAGLVVNGTAEVVEFDEVVVREDAGAVLDVWKVVGKVIGLGARLLELVRSKRRRGYRSGGISRSLQC